MTLYPQSGGRNTKEAGGPTEYYPIFIQKYLGNCGKLWEMVGNGRKWWEMVGQNTKEAGHCCFRQPGEEIQIGPNWDLSKALNIGYRLFLLRIEGYPGHFGFLLIKIHLLAFGIVDNKTKN